MTMPPQRRPQRLPETLPQNRAPKQPQKQPQKQLQKPLVKPKSLASLLLKKHRYPRSMHAAPLNLRNCARLRLRKPLAVMQKPPSMQRLRRAVNRLKTYRAHLTYQCKMLVLRAPLMVRPAAARPPRKWPRAVLPRRAVMDRVAVNLAR